MTNNTNSFAMVKTQISGEHATTLSFATMEDYFAYDAFLEHKAFLAEYEESLEEEDEDFLDEDDCCEGCGCPCEEGAFEEGTEDTFEVMLEALIEESTLRKAEKKEETSLEEEDLFVAFLKAMTLADLHKEDDK